MDLGLTDKAFLITGGSDGLGLATARRLRAEGANVFLCGRDPSRLSGAVADLEREFGQHGVAGISADVGVEGDRDALVRAAIAQWGGLDGILNNAGGRRAEPLLTAGTQSWSHDFETKVVAAADLVHRAMDSLVAAQGSVVNVLSTHARAPGAASLPSSASRAAGLAFTKSTASELAPHGVRVNALLVGLIESGQWQHLDNGPDSSNELATTRGVPMRRIGRAEEFADVATFLLSPKASYVTGAALNVDGGLCPVP